MVVAVVMVYAVSSVVPSAVSFRPCAFRVRSARFFVRDALRFCFAVELTLARNLPVGEFDGVCVLLYASI